MSKLRAFGQRGTAALEFALIASTLALLLVGTFDLGNYIHQSIVMQDAVRAGGLYAQSNPPSGSGDTTTLGNIQNAISNSVPADWQGQLTFWNNNVTAAFSCACINDSSGAITASSSCSCGNGSSLEKMLTITASKPFNPLIFNGIGAMFGGLTAVSAQNVIRYS